MERDRDRDSADCRIAAVEAHSGGAMSHVDLPSDLDPNSPEFIRTLNDRLRRVDGGAPTGKNIKGGRAGLPDFSVPAIDGPLAPTAPLISIIDAGGNFG